MKFIELTSTVYNRETNKYEPHAPFLMDVTTQWEIHDRGDSPACWVNNQMGMNKDVNETYSVIKNKLIKAGMLLDLDNIIPKTNTDAIAGEIVFALDKFARDYDGYDYGLPVCGDTMNEMRTIVVGILERK